MARLDKLLADRTDLGRKEARTRVRRGQVRVRGASGDEVVRDPAAQVPEAATIHFRGRELPPPPDLVIFHKPLGVVSTTSDPHGRPCLGDPDVAGDLLTLGLHPVGRLDAETDGLLPFSRHGAWTQHLLHPRHAVDKVYRATVEGSLPDDLGQRLAAGVATAEGVHTARLLRADARSGTVELAVTEGKHRMVRRMLANLGHPVITLRRLSFGALTLGDLPPGAWRVATPEERVWLQERLAG